MKKYLILMLLSMQIMNAQDASTTESPMGSTEVRLDVLSAIAYSKVSVSYERYLNADWSVGAAFGYSDSDKVNEDFARGYRNTLPKYDITPFVRYKMSNGIRNYYFVEAFISANGGDYKETVRRIDPNGTAFYVNETTDYTDIGAGGGVGYKMYFTDSFGVELLVAFGANLLNTDKSPDTLSRVGLSLGYRF